MQKFNSKPFVVLTDSAYSKLQHLLKHSCSKSSEKIIASQSILLLSKIMDTINSSGYIYIYEPIKYKWYIFRLLQKLRCMPRYKKLKLDLKY